VPLAIMSTMNTTSVVTVVVQVAPTGATHRIQLRNGEDRCISITHLEHSSTNAAVRK
jgi:hypothetical protein